MIHNVHKKKKTNGLIITLSSCWIVILMVSISEITYSMAQDQTPIPLPKHTYPYLIGAKNGIAAAKVGRYNVGEACTPFTYNRTSTANDLNHCIAGYYDAVAGYHDARVAIAAMKQGNANMAGEVNITKNNTTNATGSKGS
jgi:GH15 family glucan-1,4-alpha-glucosidase